MLTSASTTERWQADDKSYDLATLSGMLISLLVTLLSLYSVVSVHENETLYLLALAPYPAHELPKQYSCPDQLDPPGWADPDQLSPPRWTVGPAVIPAARLAVDHINKRSDVLGNYTLKLLEADSGCQVTTKSFVSITRAVFYSGNRIVGIVGPSCSETALALSPIVSQREVSLLQISLTTSPEVSNSTYSIVSSSFQFVNVFIKLMEYSRWEIVGALYEGYQFGAFSKFRNSVGEKLYFSVLVQDFFIPLEEIERNQVSMLFAFTGANLARQMLCLAYHMNLTYPNCQWIFSGRRIADFMEDVTVLSNGVNYCCSQETMQIATEKIILNLFQLERDNQSTNDTIAEMSYTDFLQQYRKYFYQHLEEIQLHREDIVDTRYYSPFYDATWLMALSLNNSIPFLREINLTLSDYSYGHPNATRIIEDQILKLQFEGMSGRVRFNATSRRIVRDTKVEIFQVFGAEMKYIGNYSNHVLSLHGNQTFINQSEKLLVIHLGVGVPLIIAILFLGAIIFLMQVINILYSDHKTIKASSPVLNHFIFSGCYVFIIAALIVIIQDTFVAIFDYQVLFGVLCSTMTWSFSFGITLIFGTLCGKMWRIYRIFSHFRQDRVRFVSDSLLIAFVVLLLLIDILYYVTWISINPWSLMRLNRFDQGTQLVRVVCDCDNFQIWLIILLVYKGLLIFLVLSLSIMSSGIRRKEFNRKNISVLVYFLAIFYGITMPTLLATAAGVDYNSLYLNFMSAVLLLVGSAVFCALFVFLPPILPLLKHNRILHCKLRNG